MRPTTDELIAGMRNVLEDVLVPELESDWARTMGTQMALMLRHLEGRAEREPRLLAEENARLAGALARANAILGERAVAAPDEPEGASLDELRERNGALREAMSAALAAEAGREGVDPAALPADRLGVTDDLFAINEARMAFWQPIGFSYPGRRR